MSAFDTQVGGDHYKDLAIQPAEYCQRNKLGALESFVVKYVTRHKEKGKRKDIDKAIHCLQLLLEIDYPGGEGRRDTDALWAEAEAQVSEAQVSEAYRCRACSAGNGPAHVAGQCPIHDTLPAQGSHTHTINPGPGSYDHSLGHGFAPTDNTLGNAATTAIFGSNEP
jgi:hypothetical protein